MKGILRSSGSTKEGLAFDYDPSGNRIAKHVYKPGGQLAYSTYYVRDAQGNIMSTYTFTDTASTPSFAMREQHLYGSSRLGIRKDSVELSIPVNLCNSPYSLSIVGLKQYELTNHLGNVLSVISDRKLPYSSSGSGSISYFQPEIVSATDYYPFGMVMPGRSYTAGTGYRYGFNGKENDNEVKGNGNQQDYGMRIYDSRISRFLSVDALAKEYPELTPYQFAGNIPIAAADLDGNEPDIKFDGANSIYLVGGSEVDRKVYGEAFDKTTGNGAILVGMAGGTISTLYSLYKLVKTNPPKQKPGTPSSNPRSPSSQSKVKKPDATETENQCLTNNKTNVKPRNKPKDEGVPNSSEIQETNADGKTTKYTTYGKDGKMVKEYRGEGKAHGNIPRPNVKEPKFNTNPKTGERFQNGHEVRPAREDEIPK